MSTSVTANIHIDSEATPKAKSSEGARWLDLDSTQVLGANLLTPHNPSAAVTYLNALISAAAELRDAIAADAGLDLPALAA